MSKSQAAARQLGLSSVNTRKSTFLWKITNFNQLRHRCEREISTLSMGDSKYTYLEDIIKSPSFSTNSADIKWRLVMFSMKGENQEPYLCFEFRSQDSRYYTVDVNVSISILKNDDSKYTKSTVCSIKRHAGDAKRKENSRRGFLVNFINVKSLFNASNGYLKKNELHIFCEYEVVHDYQNSEVLTFENRDLINRSFMDSLEKQWKNQQFCDYKFVAPCGRGLFAHKLILSARSPVFDAMLKTEMKEKRENVVRINDICFEALKEMLRFMYSGKVNNLNHELVDGVLAAAEKYCIADLKNLCKEFLLKSLTSENAMKTLKLCKVYNMADLKSHVDAFIKSNAKKIYCQNVLRKDDETDMYVKAIQEMAEKIKLNN